MKKLLLLGSALALALTLAACNGNDTPEVNCELTPDAPECQEPVECDTGYHEEDGECVPDAVECETGYHEENGECVPDALECETGYHEEDGECVPDDVEDTTPPVITVDSLLPVIFDEGTTEPDWTTYFSTDDATATLTVDAASADMDTVGSFIVSATATDPAGNTAVRDLVITIQAIVIPFGDCDPNFPAEEVVLDFEGEPIRFATWMRNFLDPFYLFAKQTELNAQKKTCFTRAENEHDTTIEWVSYFNDLNHYNEIIQAQIDGAHNADLYNINSHYLGILARAGAIKPITQYVEQYFPEYYWESNLQVGTWDGEIYGFWNERQNVNMTIYVNLDLIEEYSQVNPAELWQDGQWDWDAFTTMAAEVKANAPQDFKIFGINPLQAGMYFIGSNGGKTIDPYTNEFMFDDPKTVRALEFIQTLTEQEYIWFSEDGTDTATRAEFTSGNMLFYFGSDWISGDSSILKPGSAVQFTLGMTPFPVGPDVTSIATEYRLPITVGNLWVVRGDATDAEAEAYVQFFSNIIPWGDDVEQDFRYYKTMEDHTDDLTSLEAYISISRFGYFEKTYLFELAWGDDLTPGIGNLYGDIAGGASISATLDAALAALEAKRDEALGITE